MKTLGLKCTGYSTAAALCIDGKIIAASAEERFNRQKYSSSFPYQSIKFCLSRLGKKNNDIDCIAIGYDYNLSETKRKEFLRKNSVSIENAELERVNKLVQKENVIRILTNELGFHKEIIFFDHHLCHAASAFYSSGFKKSVVMTLDGKGEIQTGGLYEGDNTTLTLVEPLLYPESVGHLYEAVSWFLGFKGYQDDGKVMGLASYGKPRYLNLLKKIALIDNNFFTFDRSYFSHIYSFSSPRFSQKFIDEFGPERKEGSEITQRDKDLAASLQVIVDKLILTWAQKAKRIRNDSFLCYAGGVALNSVANYYLIKSELFKKIFIQPAASDEGTSAGAAYLAYFQHRPKTSSYMITNTYLGQRYRDKEILASIRASGLKYIISKNITKYTAEKLAQGKVIGWYQGRSEFGPRALGNRSILADPRNPEMKKIVNLKIKFREDFRPFAPSVKSEYFKEIFSINPLKISEFMLAAIPVSEKWKKKIPAVVHVDGTARPQIVKHTVNKRYWKLIDSFEKLTGIPVILNTSFNRSGEPIVNSPEDAIKCFLGSGLDILVMNNFIIEKTSDNA